jgi:dihydroorotate dehydrogenase electron transfer subunit
MLGPLGRGFTAPAEPLQVALAGGGIGIAPLVFLAMHLLAGGLAPDHIRVFLGGRSDPDLLCVSDFEEMGLQVATTTDDGSTGEQGLVTAPLERSLAARETQLVYACGPVGMLKGISTLAAGYQVACQVSIETIMACGMGACMGCAVESTDPRDDKCRHACLDGPVFDAGQIILDHF